MEEEEQFMHGQELFMNLRGGADPLFELGEGEEERAESCLLGLAAYP